jgi:hypothetical protein
LLLGLLDNQGGIKEDIIRIEGLGSLKDQNFNMDVKEMAVVDIGESGHDLI